VELEDAPLDPFRVHRSHGARQSRLETKGARHHHVALDVAERAEVRRFLSAYDGPSFAGVFHLAAVFEGGPIETLTDDSLERVMRPKVLGAWNLHEAFAGEALDAFVLFSSLATLLGFYGQGRELCEPNGFLNDLAIARRAARERSIRGALASSTLAGSAPMAGGGAEAIQALIGRIIAEIVETPPGRIDHAAPLIELGVDSLLLLELRGRIERELQLVIPIADLLDGASIASISSTLALALHPQ